MLQRIQRVGAVDIFAITAHPIGLITPAHLAAAAIGLDARRFAVAVALAAPMRAIPYAFPGTAVQDLTVAQSLAIAGVLLLLLLLPLLSRRVRGWVRGGRGTGLSAD
jgi:uncharacterized membrane protein YdjX (TVP38/TMEM64 family)